jgi:mRNA interferase YafQ
MDMHRAIERMTLIILKKPLGAEWSDHELSGNEWKGVREAHIRGDFLLIYDADDDFVEFIRAVWTVEGSIARQPLCAHGNRYASFSLGRTSQA